MNLRRDVFQALADPTRRLIIGMVALQAMTPGAIAEKFDSKRQTISKHIQILTECGLLPGAAFRAQVLIPPEPGIGGTELSKPNRPLPGALVEIERFNAARPAKLPPDEFRTLTARTDQGGVVTVSLPESGWWSITAQRDGGRREHKGKAYPVRQRATLWVWVDGKQ